MTRRSGAPELQTGSGRFIALVKEQMQAQGLSHKDLAARLGCTTVNVTQYFQPGKTLRLSTAEKLAAALGMSLEVMLVPEAAGLTAGQLQIELAVHLYEERRLSVGKAHELAGLSLWEFRQVLGSRRIPPHFDSEDLEQDLETLKGHQKS